MGYYDEGFRLSLLPGVAPGDEAKLISMAEAKFDKDSDEEDLMARTRISFGKHLKKQALIKILSYPVVIFFTLIISGTKEAYAYTELIKCYYLYIKGKMRAEDLTLIQGVATSEMIDRIKKEANEKV